MLSESEQMRREADDTGPYAEFEHWRQLNARFNSVLEQIRSHDCRMAIQILNISKAKVIKVGGQFSVPRAKLTHRVQIILAVSRLYTPWAIKTCHFSLDYNFRVS